MTDTLTLDFLEIGLITQLSTLYESYASVNQSNKAYELLNSLTGLIEKDTLTGLLENVLSENIVVTSSSNGIANGTSDEALYLEAILSVSQLLVSDLQGGLENSTLQTDELPEAVRALFTNFIVVGTPGSDAGIFTGTPKTDIFVGREGNDVLLAVDPGSANPGQGEIDFLIGDTGRDTFTLGDWNNVYYDGGGTKDFASVLDFNSNEDIIELHGTQSDYRLVDFSELQLSGQGTAIFHNEFVSDLIALVPGVSDLNLNDSYFKFEGDTPPAEPALKQIEQFGTAGIDLSFSVATDDSGNVYLTGWTTGSLEGSNAGEDDAWVAKYDSDGNQQWIRQFGTSSRDESYAIATDNFGNVYLTGVSFGSLGGSNAGIERDAWVAKYDSNGNQQWIRQFGSFALDLSFSIDVDEYGNAYVAGYTRGDLGEPNAGETDDWVAKFDTDGNQQWIRQFGTASFEGTFGLALDSTGNVYTTGWAQDNLGNLTAESYDATVVQYDSNGNQQWTRQFGTSTFDWSWDVATDSDRNVYTTGLTLGDLGGPNAGSYDAWVAKYDSDGNQQWVKQFGTTGDDTAFGITTDSFGNIYLTGTTDGDLAGANAGSYDAWVTKYDSNGNQQWIQQLGTSDLDYSYDISINSAGLIYVTGTSQGTLGTTNSGSYDAWGAQLSSTDGSLLSFNPDLVVE